MQSDTDSTMENTSTESRCFGVTQCIWAPLFLVASHMVIALLPEPEGRMFSVFFTGMILSQPILCGLWASLAPYPVVWRLPSGIASIISLNVAQQVGRNGLLGLGESIAVFFCSYGLMEAVKRVGKLQATCQLSTYAEGKQQVSYNVRYLLFWTTIVGFLLTLVRYSNLPFLLLDSAGWNWYFFEALFQILGVLVVSHPSVLLALWPSQPIARRLLWLAVTTLVPISLCGVSEYWQDDLGAAIIYASAMFGVIFASFVSALILRLADYRVTSTKANSLPDLNVPKGCVKFGICSDEPAILN